MKRQNLVAPKRLISLLLSVVLLVGLFTSFSMQADANAAMSTITVQWANPQRLRRINKKEKECILTANINGVATDIYLSFPTEGGVRVRTEKTGYFAPQSLKSIDYYSLSDGTMLLDAGDVAVKLNYTPYPWSLEFLNSAGKTIHTVSARQMYFGYKNGVLRKVKLEGPVRSNEFITGLGERYNSVNQVGKRVKLWNMDTGYHGASATTEKDLAYTNVPILTSNRGYTVFFNSYYGGYADIGSTDSEKWTMDFNGIDFDFYVYTEGAVSNLQSYTGLTGRPFVAPKWAFGYWAGHTSSYWSMGDGYDANVTNALEKYKQMGTMPSAIYLESLPFRESALEIAKSYGVRALSWNNPSVTLLTNPETGSNSLTVENLMSLLPGVAEDALPAPWNYDGTAYQAYWGDFSNPNILTALKKGGYTKLLAAGLSGTMIDYGEYIEEGLSFHNGMKGDEMHNYYGYAYTKAIHDIFEEARSGDYVLFARAGAAGSQAFAGSFGGDQAATFDGLRQAFYGGMTISASGYSNWGSDIGSLSGELTTQLYLRWLQFGTFSPFMRVHGGSERDPWSFGAIGENTFKQLYYMRYSLLDYLYSANLEAGKSGTPMMQIMAVAFPEQTDIAGEEDQYMLGTELLVRPVLDENTDYLTVTFPEGKWTDLFSGKTYQGSALVTAPINVIPVYLRDGAVIKASVSANFSLTDGAAAYDAVIAAPATEEHQSVFRADEKTAYTFTNKPDGKDGFTVSNDSKHAAKLVIAAGVTASAVKVNGRALQKLSALPENDSATGYYVDYENRRTLVFTGGGWSTVSVTDSHMAYKNLALDATVTGDDDVLASQVESVIDGDPTSMWMIHSSEDSIGIIDLGSVQKINRLVMNWSSYTPASYKLEVSDDLNGTWQNINNSTAIGGAETYRLSGAMIRYIRISEVVKGDGTASPALMDIEVYGDELIDESTLEPDYELPAISGVGNSGQNTDYGTADGAADGDEGADGPTITKKRRKKVVVVEDDGSLTTLAIVLIIVGSVVAAAGIATTVIILVRRKKRNQRNAT